MLQNSPNTKDEMLVASMVIKSWPEISDSKVYRRQLQVNK